MNSGIMDQWKFGKDRTQNVFFNCDPNSIEEKKFNPLNREEIVKEFKVGEDEYPGDERDKNFRKAAMVHKIVRSEARKKLIPGAKIKDLVEFTENRVLTLLGHKRETYFQNESTSGLAFPVGVSINNVAAHDSALLKDNRVLQEGDIIKFDFGVHVNGCIIDSAFTHIVGADEDDPYQELLNASKDATYSAIAMSGPDARILELSEIIEEVITSYQVPLDSDFDDLDIVAVKGLGGHDILPYQVHGEKLILSCPDEEIQEGMKMEEGEIYAIETYASTGDGTLEQEKDIDMCSHYMINPDCKSKRFFKKNEAAKSVKHRKGLPFTLSWCDRSHKKYARDLGQALKLQDIRAYPILRDTDPDACVSQFEHTIHIRDSCVEIYSLGNDY